MTQIIERARTYVGPEQVTLTVATSQEAARRLYDTLGFEVYGFEKHALKVDAVYVDAEHRVLWLPKP